MSIHNHQPQGAIVSTVVHSRYHALGQWLLAILFLVLPLYKGRLSVAVLLVLSVILMISGWDKRSLIAPLIRANRVVLIPCALSFGLWLLGSISLLDVVPTFWTTMQWLLSGAAIVVVLAVIWFRPKQGQIQLAIIGSLILQGLVGLSQSVLQRSLGLELLGEEQRVAAAGSTVLLVGERYILRANGLINAPNKLAPLLLLGVILLTFHHAEQRLAKLAIVIALAAAFLTYSRAGWLSYGLALLLLCVVTMIRRNKRMLKAFFFTAFMTAGVLLVGMIASYDIVATRLSPAGNRLEEHSINQRMNQHDVAFALIRDYPLRGVGLGNSNGFLQTSLSEQEYGLTGSIHNVVLRISAEIGIFGGILWVIGSLLPLIYWRRAKSGWNILLLAALILYIPQNMFAPFAWRPTGHLIYWMLLALYFNEVGSSTPRQEDSLSSERLLLY